MNYWMTIETVILNRNEDRFTHIDNEESAIGEMALDRVQFDVGRNAVFAGERATESLHTFSSFVYRGLNNKLERKDLNSRYNDFETYPFVETIIASLPQKNFQQRCSR